MKIMRDTYEINEGDTLFLARSYFRVKEVKSPTHPLFPGLIFIGHTFDLRRNVWGREHTISATYDSRWQLANEEISLTFPDKYMGAYLEPGDKVTVEDWHNGSSYWSYEVKAKVIEWGEKDAVVKITGNSWQFIRNSEVTVPASKVYRRKGH